MNNPRPNYARAVNLACRVLLRLPALHLPVSLEQIVASCPRVRLKTYSQFCRERGIAMEEFLSWSVSSHGFALRRGGQAVILYNEKKEQATARFTIAHELGHLFFLHREDSPLDQLEANCFARNLLCPPAAARLLGLETAEEYARAFRVSLPMARAALACRREDEAFLQPALAKELAGRCTGKKEPPRPAAVVRFVASGEDRRLRQAEARWLEP
ncbi:MAG TPA: ImmA/IrrE family metallo-endopeptidase [Firmicutes bacterium]|nr:ImmA/IrrE family metallo-endopeptidase [Bacillota bacterium]